MAIYKKIEEYVKDKHGFTPKSCWIAHVKELCGLPVRRAHNRKSPDKRMNPCPPDKQESIKDALKHFDMI